MRVRDLRWYILASVIIIIAYAAVAFCFYLSISSGLVENSMKSLGLEVAEEENILIEEKIDSMLDLYTTDVYNDLVYDRNEGTPADMTYEYFYTYIHKKGAPNNYDTILNKLQTRAGVEPDNYNFAYVGPANIIEGIGGSDSYVNRDTYIYFVKPWKAPATWVDGDPTPFSENGEVVIARVPLQEVLTLVENHNYIIYKNTTEDTVVLTNMDNISAADNMDGLIQGFAGHFKDGEYNEVVNLRGKSRVVSSVENKYFGYYTVCIDLDDAFIGISWVYQQAIIFYVSSVLICVAMLGLFILGCRKTSKLLRADRHSLEKTEAIVIRVDVNGHVIFSNKTFKKLFGINREVLIKDFIDVETHETIAGTMKKNKAFICEIPLDEIRDRVAYLQLTPLYISRSYYLMGTDITIDYNERQRLQELSGKNEITGLENKFIVMNTFDRIIRNDDSGMDIAFVEINIHKFNDMIQIFGRTTYNQMLLEMVKKLREIFNDMKIYHIDQAKFWVIYPNTDVNEVSNTVNELLASLEKPIQIKRNTIYVNAKVVCYNLTQTMMIENMAETDPDKQLKFETVESKLDLAYRNMGEISSKDYIVYDPSMDNILLATDEMERDIETGLLDKEFQMYLQPQFDIVNNRVDGFEALIRWTNPKYKDKSPQAFIELAEKRGHMLDIGRFVITESFKLAKKLEAYKVHISVNISPVQLLQVGFVQQLIDEFNKNQLKPGSVAIEITETLLMGSFRLIAEKLRILREKGFHIHLDDFCTGYSSMLYLKDLPVDTIKIDKEFTKYVVTNQFNQNIVKTICTLANDLNLDLVCEGVEQQEQADMVKKFGCRIIQGWLYGKAMPYDQAVDMLEKYNSKRK